MLNRIKTLASLFLELGPRWSAFRLAYAFRLRTGLIRLQAPQYKWSDRPLKHWLKPNIPSDSDSYAQWRKQNAPAFFPNVGAGSPRPDYGTTAIEEANRLLGGELKYFSHIYQKIGFPPNWNDVILSDSEGSLPTSSEILRSRRTLPQNDMTKHWSQISDDSATDIKFIWEPNRFAFVYTLVRAYAVTQDEKYPQAFWGLIQDWADKNPPNTGANWKDGQEIALRLMAWTFGFYTFIHSPSATSERISQFTQLVAAQAERIHANIGYAISTRSNHTISEAFGLWMVGLLFPELKDAEKYFNLGKRLLEEEAKKQIFPDGSYSMYSLNYHRFILHLYLYAIQLGELNHDNPSLRAALLPFVAKQSPSLLMRLLRAGEHHPRNDGIGFSDELKISVANSIQFLSCLIDPITGHMPVYGSNDGALVLPLNNCDFADYRPLLQLGSVISTGQPMFDAGVWDEDVYWLCGIESLSQRERVSEGRVRGNFPQGGTYILHNTNSRAILRCTDFTSRPSHADQLHMDLWMGSDNIAIDAGTYLYSGKGIWRNGLARTSAHNTVTVDGKDQMTMVSRFTWTNWAKGKVLKHTENLWQGEHDGYKPVRHKRTVMALEGDRWLIIDDLEANESHHYALHWLLNDVPFTQNKNSLHLNYEASTYKIQTGLTNGTGKLSILRADPKSTLGWRSRYYSHKEPAISLLFEVTQPIAQFYTFFGFENDFADSYLSQIKRL
ncbi:MAG: alginate lyase family protein [Anaerolineales bacterium]|nr:alginate lyase family protein [Anaerolineales bacterium]